MTAIPYKFWLQINSQLFAQQTAAVHVNCPLEIFLSALISWSYLQILETTETTSLNG